MEPHHGVVNMTRGKQALSPWLNNPRKTITKVEVLVVFAAVLLLLQLILGCCRRRWHNKGVHFVLQMSAKLMNPLIIYTLGTMQSSPVKNSAYPVWAALLILASVGSSAFRQHDFYEDFESKWMEALLDYTKYSFYATMFLILMDPNSYSLKTLHSKIIIDFSGVLSSSNFVALLVLVTPNTKILESTLFALLGYKQKNRSLFVTTSKSKSQSQSQSRRRLLLQQQQEEEEAAAETVEESAAAADDGLQSMKGYKYGVCHRLGQLITIEQIWDSCGSSADGNALKDLSLSCALFRQLLKQRYFEQVCPETSSLHVDDFVFKKLLPSEGDFKRAFRIIEVELCFCYDFFFTKHHYTFLWMNFLAPLPLLPAWILLKIILILSVGVFAVRRSLVLETPNPIIEVRMSGADYIITLLVLSVALTVELVQAAFYLASDWAQVSLACLYVKRCCCDQPIAPVTENFIGFLRKFMISGQLRNKINQHSVIVRNQHSVIFRRRYQQPHPVEVSDAVKRAVARSLISSHHGNTNGLVSISRGENQMLFDEYSWALKDLSQPQLEVMLIWHIATEYCAAIPPPHHPSSSVNRNAIATSQDGHRGVAVQLSRYCAYLIGYVPELLPYPEADIAELAQELMQEREELLGSSYKPSEIYNKMKDLTEDQEDDHGPGKMFRKGVKLGKQLERRDHRWELLKDFWAERIIHAAASHYTSKQHMLRLEKGGEFLTHIWALLSHAGALNLHRDSQPGNPAAA